MGRGIFFTAGVTTVEFAEAETTAGSKGAGCAPGPSRSSVKLFANFSSSSPSALVCAAAPTISGATGVLTTSSLLKFPAELDDIVVFFSSAFASANKTGAALAVLLPSSGELTTSFDLVGAMEFLGDATGVDFFSTTTGVFLAVVFASG